MATRPSYVYANEIGPDETCELVVEILQIILDDMRKPAPKECCHVGS